MYAVSLLFDLDVLIFLYFLPCAWKERFYPDAFIVLMQVQLRSS